MKREKVIKFLEEFICWIVILIILELVAHSFGWNDNSIMDNIIGLSIGWILWKVIMVLINKRNK